MITRGFWRNARTSLLTHPLAHWHPISITHAVLMTSTKNKENAKNFSYPAHEDGYRILGYFVGHSIKPTTVPFDLIAPSIILQTIMSSSVSALFQPLPVGAINIGHRIVMAPVTRFRANKAHVHGELAKTYYTQRARALLEHLSCARPLSSPLKQEDMQMRQVFGAMRKSLDGKPFVQLHVLQCFGKNN